MRSQVNSGAHSMERDVNSCFHPFHAMHLKRKLASLCRQAAAMTCSCCPAADLGWLLGNWDVLADVQKTHAERLLRWQVCTWQQHRPYLPNIPWCTCGLGVMPAEVCITMCNCAMRLCWQQRGHLQDFVMLKGLGMTMSVPVSSKGLGMTMTVPVADLIKASLAHGHNQPFERQVDKLLHTSVACVMAPLLSMKISSLLHTSKW
jgi:hypothetical protein